MKTQTGHFGTHTVRYELGDTWFDGTLELVGDSPEATVRISGTEAVIALRDFLNSLDFSGRKLSLVKSA